jgi:ABC-type branched-subunit amino acid transport system ATPase component
MEATMNSTIKPPLNQRPLNNRPLLEVQDIYSGYQPDFDILHGVSLHVKPTEIVCVIGPNGAGKSTIFKALFGFLKVRRGRVLFDDRDITNIRPQEALLAGITIVPQLRSVFPQMTVFENLEMGMYLEKNKERIKRRINFILELFPRLGERAKQKAGTMSGGEQRMLEIGRALMWEPKLMLMDEPSAGLAPLITRTIFNDVRRLNREIGLTVLMIEQNARQGLKICDRGYVLELGRNSYEGTGQELLENEEVRRAFLGGR